MTQSARWDRRAERGSDLGMRIIAWFYRSIGRRAARLLLFPVVAYFFATDPSARRASLAYLRRVHAFPEGARRLGREPGPGLVFRHLYSFGVSILDRVAFWMGRRGDFTFEEVQGEEELTRVIRDGRGAVLLGSHLGSFDAMRLLAAVRAPIPVNFVMYTAHAERINALFARLSARSGEPAARTRVIPVRPGSFEHVLESRACIERGEVVAILADRVPLNDASHSCRVKFLGGIAAIPEGPFRMAAVLGAPVVMMTALRCGDARYEFHVERLTDRVVFPRSQRAAALQALCQSYADRLAAHCLRFPLQWFNFYDFWLEDSPARDA